ncbi:hypothetical protein [Bradyrhizobium elkanii]|uniref:Uncharacterized protein n=1 Tax=Bradyrhizobium elkanii TaxID=29448 RepID=A0ABV4FC44_BRAEL|nr:hypothetical protein [Bradyrhizobium elkanii]MCP1752003.1 hypothetical protein [Bradyrhizobium elkanii]MCP1977774.1 hypothetical protein [Bradyrhizobium elkanii]MCS3887709.1 hypothetical protein [Bradyrhizobium elkanii]MCS4213272.1 hypothetical protein [Bradyrhizobium elkanii]MCW2213579.1 hypothetical protein [Bradyrhizobium elkanii]
MNVTTIPQHVRWGPNDERPAGISIIGENGVESTFMRWNDLQSELEHKLMPQLFVKPEGFRFQARDHQNKSDWLVQIIDGRGEWFCDVWLGGNPDNGWAFDGFVHVGDPAEAPHVWQSYQRYSDGTYRRLPSRVASLDQFRDRNMK